MSTDSLNFLDSTKQLKFDPFVGEEGAFYYSLDNGNDRHYIDPFHVTSRVSSSLSSLEEQDNYSYQELSSYGNICHCSCHLKTQLQKNRASVAERAKETAKKSPRVKNEKKMLKKDQRQGNGLNSSKKKHRFGARKPLSSCPTNRLDISEKNRGMELVRSSNMGVKTKPQSSKGCLESKCAIFLPKPPVLLPRIHRRSNSSSEYWENYSDYHPSAEFSVCHESFDLAFSQCDEALLDLVKEIERG